MSRILVAASPAPGHVNPLIAIAESLSKRGHRVTFNSADIFRSKAESAGLHFVPLQGKANLDYHLLDRNFPERKTIEPGMPQLNYDMKYIFGDWIPDQYRGIKEIIEDQDIDLLITDFLFLGTFPLLLNSKEPRPPVLACGIAPVLMRTPDSSPFAGPDSTPEGLLRNAGGDRFEVFSAGTEATMLRPLAIRAMQEIGIDIAGQQSKTLERYLDQPFDQVITVCDQANEACPVFFGARERLHWSFPDPSQATGSEDEQLAVYRQVRDAIRQRIASELINEAAQP